MMNMALNRHGFILFDFKEGIYRDRRTYKQL